LIIREPGYFGVILLFSLPAKYSPDGRRIVDFEQEGAKFFLGIAR
jgi:hypothetical protein